MKLHAGWSRFRTSWIRWLPLYLSPCFQDERRPWRTARGFMIGTFGWCVYVLRCEHGCESR